MANVIDILEAAAAAGHDPNRDPNRGGGGGTGGTKQFPGTLHDKGGSPFAGTGGDDALGIYGLPLDLTTQLLKLRAQYPHTADGDNQYIQAALALVRGSEWYRQTFPGIAEARALGYIGTGLGSEGQYRQLYLQYNTLYKQYYGRDMTWDEAYRLFANGTSPDFVAKHFAGTAYVAANRNDLQYLAGAFTESGRLNDNQLVAYGDETAGIDTPLGAMLNAKLQQAQAKLQRIFQGTAATPSLQIGGAGLSAPGLQGTRIGANPDIPA